MTPPTHSSVQHNLINKQKHFVHYQDLVSYIELVLFMKRQQSVTTICAKLDSDTIQLTADEKVFSKRELNQHCITMEKMSFQEKSKKQNGAETFFVTFTDSET